MRCKILEMHLPVESVSTSETWNLSQVAYDNALKWWQLDILLVAFFGRKVLDLVKSSMNFNKTLCLNFIKARQCSNGVFRLEKSFKYTSKSSFIKLIMSTFWTAVDGWLILISKNSKPIKSILVQQNENIKLNIFNQIRSMNFIALCISKLNPVQ